MHKRAIETTSDKFDLLAHHVPPVSSMTRYPESTVRLSSHRLGSCKGLISAQLPVVTPNALSNLTCPNDAFLKWIRTTQIFFNIHTRAHGWMPRYLTHGTSRATTMARMESFGVPVVPLLRIGLADVDLISLVCSGDKRREVIEI